MQAALRMGRSLWELQLGKQRQLSVHMETGNVFKRRRMEPESAEMPAGQECDSDCLRSLSQQLRQALQDSNAAVENLSVSDEQQGQAAAAVLRRMLHVHQQLHYRNGKERSGRNQVRVALNTWGFVNAAILCADGGNSNSSEHHLASLDRWTTKLQVVFS